MTGAVHPGRSGPTMAVTAMQSPPIYITDEEGNRIDLGDVDSSMGYPEYQSHMDMNTERLPGTGGTSRASTGNQPPINGPQTLRGLQLSHAAQVSKEPPKEKFLDKKCCIIV